MKHESKKYKMWLPLLATVCCAALTLILYACRPGEKETLVVLQVAGTAFIPAILPLLSRVTKKRLPLLPNVLIAIHIVLAMDFGSAMHFYDIFSFWDMLLHGYFGLVASVCFYLLQKQQNGEKGTRPAAAVWIFLSTMGCAALWEIFEFVCDRLLDGDAQRVAESVAMGKTPVYDTMMDMIITIVGVAVFFLGRQIALICKQKLEKRGCCASKCDGDRDAVPDTTEKNGR